MIRILGVDPGSRNLGYGCVEVATRRMRHIASGTLKVHRAGPALLASSRQSPSSELDRAARPSNPSNNASDLSQELRLLQIYQGLSEIILLHRPSIMVVEKVFFAKNALSALKLGQARGAVLLTGAIHHLTIVEYSPNEVKRAVVGQGHAEKHQVARMVEILLGSRQFGSHDESDGLALAICHAQNLLFSDNATRIPQAPRYSSKRKMSLAEALGFPQKSKTKG